MSLINQPQQTLSERLPYYGFEPKTDAIWLKDGSATLSLKVTPRDCSLFTDDDLESMRAGLLPILNHLPDGAVLQALLLRERTNAMQDEAYSRWRSAHSGNDNSSEERNHLMEARMLQIEEEFQNKNIFQTRCYLTLRVLPSSDPKPGKTMGPFSHLGFWFQGKKGIERSRAQIISQLSSAFDSLTTGLAAIGFEVKHVPHPERVAVIYEWLNPERSIALSPPPYSTASPLSDQLGLTDLIENPNGLSLGRSGVEIASLKSLPEISVPAAMQELSCSNIPFALLLTIYVLPQTQERERLVRKQRLAQGMASGNMVRNLLAEAQLRDIEDTLGALISSGEKIFGVSFHMSGRREME